MKKIYLKFIIAFILLLLIIVPNKVLAITSSGDYTIESYDIDMVVNENNTFDITEHITAYFNTSKHRDIQKNTLKKYYNKNRWHYIK